MKGSLDLTQTGFIPASNGGTNSICISCWLKHQTINKRVRKGWHVLGNHYELTSRIEKDLRTDHVLSIDCNMKGSPSIWVRWVNQVFLLTTYVRKHKCPEGFERSCLSKDKKLTCSPDRRSWRRSGLSQWTAWWIRWPGNSLSSISWHLFSIKEECPSFTGSVTQECDH